MEGGGREERGRGEGGEGGGGREEREGVGQLKNTDMCLTNKYTYSTHVALWGSPSINSRKRKTHVQTYRETKQHGGN